MSPDTPQADQATAPVESGKGAPKKAPSKSGKGTFAKPVHIKGQRFEVGDDVPEITEAERAKFQRLGCIQT